MSKNNIKLTEPYPETKTNVAKYVYHLTYKYNRESILREGLINLYAEKDQRVFAHNTDRFETCWYWFCLDMYESRIRRFNYAYEEYIHDCKSLLRYAVNSYYDIWRIDTEKVNKDWYIDYVGLYDQLEKVKENYYVKCYNAIDVDALTLCTLDIDTEYDFDTDNGIKMTYYNPIIAREDFINKYSFEPEDEVLIAINSYKIIDLPTDNHKDEYYWKDLGKSKFSYTDYVKEFDFERVA
jgi:hypothetical protein